MPRLLTREQAENLIFESYHQRQPLTGDDAHTRDLSPIESLYHRAGITQKRFPTITITGSKGKGSTAIFAAALLQQMGLRVGLVTSPHYRHINERIRLNGHSISDEAFTRIATDLASHIRAIRNRLKPTQYLSPNGLSIAIALRYFQEHAIDALVLEAGRGGRFDEVRLFTNQVAVITRIDHEHSAQLGTTLARIAWHKSGIIQPTSTLLTGDIPDEALAIIRDEHARTSRKPHQRIGHEISVASHHNERDLHTTITLPNDAQISCQLATYAPYQAHNLALAWGAVDALLPHLPTAQHPINWEVAASILPRVRLFGRCQRISQHPDVWVDGAIHRPAAQAFLEGVLPHSPPQRILLAALPADKDGSGVLDALAPHVQHIILTQPEAGYLYYDAAVEQHARRTHSNTQLVTDVGQAIRNAIAQARDTHSALWIIGTQSLVRAALNAFQADLTQIAAPQGQSHDQDN